MKHVRPIGELLRKRAISLIEGVLYLVVALAIIVGGIVFFQQANFNRQVNSVAGMMTSVSSYLLAQTKEVSNTSADSEFVTGDATTYAIRSGAIQSDMVDRAQGAPDTEVIRMPWGGIVTLQEAAARHNGRRMPVIAMRMNDLPTGACMRLGHKNANGTSMIGGRVFALGVEENNIHDDNLDWVSGDLRYIARAGEDTDMAALAEACKGGERDLIAFYDVSGVPDDLPAVYDVSDPDGDGEIPNNNPDSDSNTGGDEGGSDGGGDGSGDGSGGDGDGSGGGTGGDGDAFCPPSNWSWNAARSEYTVPGIQLFHKDSRHGNTVVSLNDPGTTTKLRVPAVSTSDLFEFSRSRGSRTYWNFVRHIERGDLVPPGDNC